MCVPCNAGLTYVDKEIGSGKEVRKGNKVAVRYRGILKSGKEFDSNLPKGQPFVFTVTCVSGMPSITDAMHRYLAVMTIESSHSKDIY